MSHNKLFTVAALGLAASEMRFVKIMLGLTSHESTQREEGRYIWIEDEEAAQILIVNSEDENAMSRWHEISLSNPAAILLLITATNQVPYTKYHCVRPVGPSKILAMLDKIAAEWKFGKAEPQVFAGNNRFELKEPARWISEPTTVRRRALVVDDSPTVRRKLVLELGCFNVKTDTAETGEVGLELLRENRYDIIFLDVVLPGMDGYQVCKSIRRNPEWKTVPVIMLSGKSSPFDKVRGALAGCNSYLTKPVEYENFYRILGEYLVHDGDEAGKQRA